MEGLAFSGETEAVNNILSEVCHCLVPSTAYISDLSLQTPQNLHTQDRMKHTADEVIGFPLRGQKATVYHGCRVVTTLPKATHLVG